MKNKRTGFVDIVTGISSYEITFDPPFSFPPNRVETSLQLAGAGAEFLSVAANKSTITKSGATLLLSGSPTETSEGSRITWRAKI